MDECCCLGFLLARNALNSGSVLAIFTQIEGKMGVRDFGSKGTDTKDFI